MIIGSPSLNLIAIPCQDTTIDNIADVSVCTTWDNQSNNNCHSAADAVPNTASKCNCNSLPVANIVFLATCTTNSDCNDNNACTADSCDTDHTCVILKNSGELKCWGAKKKIKGLSANNLNVKQIAVSEEMTCFIDKNDMLNCFGES